MEINQILESLRNLHDSEMLQLDWRKEEQVLSIFVHDLHANFRSLPNYQGPTKATFRFHEVGRFMIDVDLMTPWLTIYDCTVGHGESLAHHCDFSFAPGGKMTLECNRIELIHA